MTFLSMMAFIIATISFLIILILNLTSKKSFSDREKSSPFECGFDPKSSARLPFSIQFFLIAIIFLIFDVEITLILPYVKNTQMMSITEISMNFIILMFILITGTAHEWNQGALNWKT
uniref:NADH-ubiquinone oxidoreductase chain 3 n=1 Tax=Oryzaephilus surinamensis TaxID=41112 RepID=A0A1P8YZL2_ORYSU|nr:NADH dehydrogenase subunit 3 [Oryzaephilus surinamensis]QCP68865.1 NADH dehydrogenase subunit 3 [Oryzaephilus surinamensis]UNH68022.1 NADH dehydrogenase subunit 3 [Oryzaephilus surinamensis]